jgi:hypothetical protein
MTCLARRLALVPITVAPTISSGSRRSDRTVGLDGVPDGYRAMADRESIKVLITRWTSARRPTFPRTDFDPDGARSDHERNSPSMTTKIKIAPLALVPAVALVASAPPFAQSSTRDRGMGRLAGEWRMTSLEVGTAGNLQRVPYSGQIIFTKAGTMSVHAMNPDTNAPDTPYTSNGYEAFYGSVTVDRAAGTFAVRVTSSVVRNMIGQRLTRVFKVSKDRLVLTPPDPAEGWRVTYKRVK